MRYALAGVVGICLVVMLAASHPAHVDGETVAMNGAPASLFPTL